MTIFRRLTAVFAVLVLIGAAINVPLAVHLFAIGPPAVQSRINLRGDAAGAQVWPAQTPHAAAWPAITQWQEARGLGVREIHAYSREFGAMTGFQMWVRFAGWPFPVLREAQLWWPWDDPKWRLASNSGAKPPLELLWFGLVMNPIVFAGTVIGGVGLTIGLRAAWRWLVARWRRKRSCCPSCGYALGQSAVCTECGTSIPEELAGARSQSIRVPPGRPSWGGPGAPARSLHEPITRAEAAE